MIKNTVSGSSREFRLRCILFLSIYMPVVIYSLISSHRLTTLIVISKVGDHGSRLRSRSNYFSS